MIRYLAVAALTVMFANPLPGQAAENGLSRNGITRNGADLNIGAAAGALGSAHLVTVELPR